MTNRELLNEIILKYKEIQIFLSQGKIRNALFAEQILRGYVDKAQQRGILVGLNEGPILYSSVTTGKMEY